jgi:hypothetical protein
MPARRYLNLPHVSVIVILVLLLIPSCRRPTVAQVTANSRLVELVAIDVDPKRPERRSFGSLTLLSAFQLAAKSKRFGGLSGLSIGADGKLYAVSDRGYWLSASMLLNPNGALKDIVEWRIAPILSTSKRPVSGKLKDAEALAQTRDGSFLVAFEGYHRIWRYSPLPNTFESTPVSVQIPTAVAHAPSNGGIEALAALPNGRLLIIAEELENPDGSVKAWVIDDGQFTELSYLPAKGFRVTDCAALKNGDVLVLERRYVPFGIFSSRITLVKAGSLRPGAKLAGKELLKLEQPQAVENFEGIAAQETSNGTVIFIVSDDNYSRFQQTLLLQFLLPHTDP